MRLLPRPVCKRRSQTDRYVEGVYVILQSDNTRNSFHHLCNAGVIIDVNQLHRSIRNNAHILRSVKTGGHSTGKNNNKLYFGLLLSKTLCN